MMPLVSEIVLDSDIFFMSIFLIGDLFGNRIQNRLISELPLNNLGSKMNCSQEKTDSFTFATPIGCSCVLIEPG